MLQVNIVSAVRTVFGKGPMRQLRMENITPGVLYSGGKEALPLQFDAGQLFKNLLFIQGRNAVVTLQVEGDEKEKRDVLVQEIQKDPVTGSLVHVDFLEIDLGKALEFVVPIEYTGTAKGVDLGGDMQIFKTSIKLKGNPLDIPDVVKVDVTPLEKGGAGFTYGDLAVPENVEMMEKPSVTCVTVY